MSSCEHISKKSEQACRKPCPDTFKKRRCEKHGGSDLINFITTIEPIDDFVNPYKPASKEWLDWNKKQKKKSKKEEFKVKDIEKNPFFEPVSSVKNSINTLKYNLLYEDLQPLCLMNGKYLLRGTPVYVNAKSYFVCKSIKIELLVERNFKGWGTTEIELVTDEYDIDSKGQIFSINSIVIRECNIYNSTLTLPLETMNFRKFMTELGRREELCIVDDVSNKTDEKENLLEIAGHNGFVKHSIGFNSLDIDSKDKYTITIKLDNLSIEELKKLIEKKLVMRENYGDDYIYREFLYKKYGVKKMGGPEIRKAPDTSGGKAFENVNI